MTTLPCPECWGRPVHYGPGEHEKCKACGGRGTIEKQFGMVEKQEEPTTEAAPAAEERTYTAAEFEEGRRVAARAAFFAAAELVRSDPRYHHKDLTIQSRILQTRQWIATDLENVAERMLHGSVARVMIDRFANDESPSTSPHPSQL
jgi:hypothetical protein